MADPIEVLVETIATCGKFDKEDCDMKPEDKLLLLQDLSARLPHGVICKTSKGNGHLCSINQHIFGIEYGININATKRDYFNDKEEIKSYLRPMSSMTEEEKKEYTSYCFEQPFLQKGKTPNLGSVPMCIDWLNKKMFDFRGLIPKDLAISTEVFNPYKD